MEYIKDHRNPAECQWAWWIKAGPNDDWEGYMCSLSKIEEGCTAPDGKCPAVTELPVRCPKCAREGTNTTSLLHDEDADLFACDICGNMMFPDTVEREWVNVRKIPDYHVWAADLLLKPERRQGV